MTLCEPKILLTTAYYSQENKFSVHFSIFSNTLANELTSKDSDSIENDYIEKLPSVCSNRTGTDQCIAF